MTAEFDPTAFESFDESSLVIKDVEDEEREEVEAEGSQQQQTGSDGIKLKQATVFVIDCSIVHQRHLPQKLFESQRVVKKEVDEGVILLASQEHLKDVYAWEETFKSIASFMRSRILANKFDKVGVILYGVSRLEADTKDDNRQQSEDSSFPGIVTLLDLDFLSANGIKTIEYYHKQNYRSFSQHFSNPEDSHGNPIEPKFSELFWYLNKLFSRKSNLQQYHNEVFLLTANDNPCLSKSERTAAIQRIRDMDNNVAKFECLAMEIPGVPAFDVTKFYSEFYGDEIDMTQYGASTLSKIAETMRKKVYAQRALSQLSFEILDDFKIGVNVYSSIIAQRRPSPYTLNSNDHKPLKIQRQLICESTADILVDEQIQKFLPHGGEKIFISKEEKQKLMHFGDGLSHLRLIGFKPLNRLKRHHTIKHPSFLYPNDTQPPTGVAGSSDVVSALIHSMIEKKVFAVCRYVRAKNAAPRLVALLPQPEELDQDGQQVTSPGFHLLPLPFADDLRRLHLTESNPLKENPTKKSERVGLAIQLLNKLRLHVSEGSIFDCHDISNPAIQQHYRALEAMALGHKEPTSVVDVMDIGPPISEKVTKIATQWKEKLFAQHGVLEGKKPASSGRTRQTLLASFDDIPSLAEKVQLGSLLVSDLKAFCSEKGLPVSGKKADLADRIEKYLKRKSAKGEQEVKPSRGKRVSDKDEDQELVEPVKKKRR